MNSHVRQTNRDAITIPLQTAASLYDGREILQKSGRNMGDIRRFCLIFYGRATARRRRHRHPATTDFSRSQKPEDTPPSMTPRTTSRAGTPRHQRNHHNLPEIPAQIAIPGQLATQQPEDAPLSATCRAPAQTPYTSRVVRRVARATSAIGRSKTSASAASVYGIMYGALVRPR